MQIIKCSIWVMDEILDRYICVVPSAFLPEIVTRLQHLIVVAARFSHALSIIIAGECKYRCLLVLLLRC